MHGGPGDDYWDVWSTDGLRSRYGTARPAGEGSTWRDPAVIRGPEGNFAWLISETEDLAGNRILYGYRPDPASTAMRYLAEIRYADYTASDGTPDHLISVELDYEARPDPFSDRRPGFELRTTQRAVAIRVFTDAGTPTLATSVALSYCDSPAGNGVSLLSRVVIAGHAGGEIQPLPPLEFGYTAWQPQARRFQPLTGDLPPTSIGSPGMDLVDLFGDGRPCILELNGFARYWRNRGDGAFDPPRALREAPAGVALGAPGVQLADMDGDGRPDLVVSNALTTGYWPLQRRRGDAAGAPAGFDPTAFVQADRAPTFSLFDPSVRLIDLDGDGRMDALRAGERPTAAFNDGRGGFGRLQVLRAPDGLRGLDFSDPRVRLADMTGDGLTDIVLLYRRNVSYWPNLGHGRFGPRVVMANGPDFDDGAQYDITGFDPRRLLIGDVDGDGAADLVYVGDGHVTVWVNRSGNSLAEPVVIAGTPRVSDASAIRLSDIEGTGVAGVLWTADSIRRRTPYAFLDLTGRAKPYLLNHFDNHRGATTSIEYSTSTRYAEADRDAGRPWRTTLPLPVHVVAGLTVTDAFSDSALTTEYRYHHGYWDGADREFRGFARVDQRDARSSGQDRGPSPPTETRTWFHVGPVGPEAGDWAPLDLSDEYWAEDPSMLGSPVIATLPDSLTRRQLRDACRALRGATLRTELYALDGAPAQDRPYAVTEHRHEITLAGGLAAPDGSAASPAFFPHPVAERTTEWERGTDPRTRIRWTDGHDGYGRPRHTLELAVPRGRDPRRRDEAPPGPYPATLTTVEHLTRDDTRYICDRVARTSRCEIINGGTSTAAELHDRVRSGAGAFFRPLSTVCTRYDGKPLGELGDWGLPTTTEHLAVTLGQVARAFADGETVDGPPPYLMAGDACPAAGVRAAYYHDTELTDLALVRPEHAIDRDYRGQAPDPVLDPRGFSVRWTGTVRPRHSETYTFTPDCTGGSTQMTGGVRIWIGVQQVFDDWAGAGTVAPTPIALRADEAYAVRVEYRTASAAANLTLRWSSASQTDEPVPQTRLAPPPWRAEWAQEYPAAFRQAAGAPAGAAGYSYRQEDAWHWPGYYTTLERRYDVQDGPGGRGLLTWQKDALGNPTTIAYDAFDLLPASVTNAAGLVTAASYDYRVLKPRLIADANGNETLVAYTPLGLPASIAIMGKRDEPVGDHPDHPGTRFSYGLTAFDDHRLPLWVHTVKRVEHAWTLIAAAADQLGRALSAEEIAALFGPEEPVTHPERFLQRREYSDGCGRLLQARSQGDDLVVDDLGLPLAATAPPTPVVVHEQDPDAPQVIVSGWQAYDDKGRVVGKWEPFFDRGWDFAAPTDPSLAASSRLTIHYDPRGLAIRTVFPDGSCTRVVIGVPRALATPEDFAPTPWEAYSYDRNDNAGRSDPAGSAAWRDHWDTPSSTVQDALGRVVATAERTATETYVTRSAYDIDGNLLEVIDPLGRTASSAVYDSLGRAWRTHLLDNGTSRSILDPLGGAVERRDGKGALVLTDFDELHRHRRQWARDLADRPTTLREVSIYGEHAGLADPAADNILGRLYASYDEAGRVVCPSYDLVGNVLRKRRCVLAPSLLLAHAGGAGGGWQRTAYEVDWQPPAGQAREEYAEALLDATSYDIDTTYDALQRPTQIRAPVDVTGHRTTLTPVYGLAGSLTRLDVDGTTYVERLSYNARGQRRLCVLGNGVMTRYAYHPRTFRLARLRSEPCAATSTGWRSAGAPLQDHGYPTYDQVGNLCALLDTTPGAGAGARPGPLERSFAYNALYWLVSASGREASAPLATKPWLEPAARPGAASVRRYVETYAYDAAGNLRTLKHRPQSADCYTHTYEHAVGSNQLDRLVTGQDTYGYTFDAAGNLLTETTSRRFEWDHANRLATFRVQPTSAPEPSKYVQCRYDSAGQRIIKVVRRQGGQLQATIYIDSLFERLIVGSGPTATRHDLVHVMDNRTRVAMIRAGPAAPGDTAPPIVYELGDHLGSSEVSLDAAGQFLYRQESLPYGGTSLGAYAKRRYRFNGKERDEESGLYYYGGRYYAPWTARWQSCDPKGTADGLNLYRFVRGNPVNLSDSTGAYGFSGHYDSTYLIALAAGWPPEVAKRQAFWAQAPDQIRELDAASVGWEWFKSQVGAGEPNLWFTTWIVQAGGHALTGRSADHERNLRRTTLAKTEPGTFTSGQASHALEDSYAHTEMNGYRMYPGPYGHSVELRTFDFHAPDQIAMRPGLYSQMALDLYRSYVAMGAKHGWQPRMRPPELGSLMQRVGQARSEADQRAILDAKIVQLLRAAGQFKPTLLPDDFSGHEGEKAPWDAFAAGHPTETRGVSLESLMLNYSIWAPPTPQTYQKAPTWGLHLPTGGD